MDGQRGQGRARGRGERGRGFQQPSSGGPPPGGRGRQAPSRPAGNPWGPPPGGQAQQRGPPPSGNQGQQRPQQPPAAWGPAAPSAQHQVAGRAAPPSGEPISAVGVGGDASSRSGPISRGGARSGRKIELENIIITRPQHVANSKQGKAGQTVRLRANYFELQRTQPFTLYQYRVDFAPDDDRTAQRKAYMANALANRLNRYIFDGTVLYTIVKLTDSEEQIFVSSNVEGETVRVTIKLVGDVMPVDYHYLQVFNLILRKCMSALKLQLIGRNYFDPKAKIQINDWKMELWPGYLTSLRQHEKQILMCAEIMHKVVRFDNAFGILQACLNSGNRDYKTEFANTIVGVVVVTPYNDRHYRIDDIDWDSTPMSTFQMADGRNITYKDYYYERYKVNIKNLKQPLLVSRAKKRELRAGMAELAYLVPELCIMTGLTDDQRSNVNLMRALANHTRIEPSKRIERLLNFCKRLQSAPEAMNELKQWDMRLADQLVELPGRVLPSENICAGRQIEYSSGPQVDWTRNLRSNPMFTTKDLSNWILFVHPRAKGDAQNFVKMLCDAARGMQWNLPQPKVLEITDDRPPVYAKAIHEGVQQFRPQFVMCIVSNNKSDRYSAIKKKLYCDFDIPSQVICQRTLNNKGVMSIATKVAIQMNCKLGGAPWAVAIPATNIMVVGFDVCHDAHDKRKSYGGMCASMNKPVTHYYSQVSEHGSGEELSNDIALLMLKACQSYFKINKQYPDRIIFYRDGVGDGQIGYVVEHEVKQIIKILKDNIYQGLEPKIAVIVVSKRINTRFFYNSQNAVPGTVVDDIVTLPNRYDFFLTSQCVRQGTVTPTSYNIIYDTSGFTPDIMQRLTYKLTHAYYNWSGTVRVPAPCQYAHKLAFLVSQALQRLPNENLNTLLYYL